MLDVIANHAADICAIATCAALLIKPVREWVMGTGQIKDGQKCLLRSEIVRIYYRHVEDQTLREYEYKNMDECYKAYKALGGNSFIDHLHSEMEQWDIKE